MYSERQIGKTRILIVDDLSPEDVAMVQALYARSSESAKIHINKIYEMRRQEVVTELENWISADADPMYEKEHRQRAVDRLVRAGSGTARAGKFMSSYYVGYGHKSIGDCGSTTMFIEGVTTLVAKAIEDWPLYSGQETSTRALDLTPSLDPEKLVGLLHDPVGTPASRDILDRWMAFYTKSQETVAREVRRRHPRQPEEPEDIYEKAVKARVFDVLRAFLPAGVTVQLSWHSNLRQAGDHLVWLVHHPLTDVRLVGRTLAEMLNERYPSSGASFGELASLSGIGSKTEGFGDRHLRQTWETWVGQYYAYSAAWDPEFCCTTIDREELERHMQILRKRPRGAVVPHFLSDLGRLRFNFELDFGSFRDLQRHRNGVCRMPLLTTEFGFESWYLEQLDQDTATEAMALVHHQTKAIDQLDATPAERQNYIALGYKVPCNVTYALPAAIYVMELRGGKTVHPTLRAVVHKMADSFHGLYPDVALHVDLDADSWTIRRGTQTITRKEA